jgi:hypothetical protein
MLSKLLLFLLSVSVAVCASSQDAYGTKKSLKALLGEGAGACYNGWIGDKVCDKACNNKASAFDGGDCNALRFKSMEGEEDSIEVSLKGFEVVYGKHTTINYKLNSIGPTVRRGEKLVLKCKADNSDCEGKRSLTLLPMDKYNEETSEGKMSLDMKEVGGNYEIAIPDTGPVGVLFAKVDGQDVGKVVVLFNPYKQGSPVYLENEKKRNEYVENGKGLLYYGNAGNEGPNKYDKIGQMDWVYAQDDKNVQKVVLSLLSLLDPADRHDPRLVGRHFTRVLASNFFEDVGEKVVVGVLEGRWDGEYGDGEKPTSWSGTRAIFTDYLKGNMKASVKYGQCWVFAAILTSSLRYLGIPSRPLSNFRSAHDTPVKNSRRSRAHYDRVITAKKESIWNFHVWVDAWMKRDDITPTTGYGWNALDATPQEESYGHYQMGPAFVPYIKRNSHIENKANYDAEFVLGEVNAVHRYPKRDDRVDVGRAILTKKVLSTGSDDLVDMYKMCPSGFYIVIKGKCGFLISGGKFAVTKEAVNSGSVPLLDYRGSSVKPLHLLSKTKVTVLDSNGQEVDVYMKELSLMTSGGDRPLLLEISNDDEKENRSEQETGGLKKGIKLLVGKVKHKVRKGIKKLKLRKGASWAVSHANVGYNGLSDLFSRRHKHWQRAGICKGCFSIVQQTKGPLYVNKPVAIQIQRGSNGIGKGKTFKAVVKFEIVSNNGQNLEGKSFHEMQIDLSPDEEFTNVILEPSVFHKHISKALTLRVTMRSATQDKKLVDFDQELFQLRIPTFDVKVVPSEEGKKSMKLTVSFSNPLTISLTGITVYVDDEVGDRKVEGNSKTIGAGESVPVDILVPSKPHGKHCAILSLECDQIFGLGWEKEVCWGSDSV